LHLCACDANACLRAVAFRAGDVAALPTAEDIRAFLGRADGVREALDMHSARASARAELVGPSQRAGGGRRRRRDDRDEADADVDVDEGAPELLTFPELPPTRRCRVCGDLSVRCPCGKDMARGRAAALADEPADDLGGLLDPD
jgi:hypothetical protein